MSNDELIVRIKNLYTNFSAESMNGLGSIYDENVEFIDPFHKINGRNELKKYWCYCLLFFYSYQQVRFLS